MKFGYHILAACLLLMASSCNYKSGKSEESVQTADIQLEQIQSIDTAIVPAPPGTNDEKANNNTNPRTAANADWDKKIIKSGRMEVEVDDYDAYNNSVHQLVKKYAGYIANEQLTNNDYKIQNDLSIRIPVEYFDEAVQQVAALKGKLQVREISAQDVTSEYFDTRARMEAKKRVRVRYLDMLNKAKNMEEVLQVEREINAIQEQIDAGEGRIKYLGHAAAYSTLNLSFYQILNSSARDVNEPFFADRLVNAFVNGANGIGELMILAVNLWPLWILGAVVIVAMRSKKLKVKS